MSSNRRAPGQTLINLPVKQDFLELVDGNLESIGYADRSKFIRDAMREKLIAMGKDVPIELTMPPGRAGKGGRKKTSISSGRKLAHETAMRTIERIHAKRGNFSA